ncbi:hypothetical protein thsrh120_30800 [Rhizobium sp. No.120]
MIQTRPGAFVPKYLVSGIRDKSAVSLRYSYLQGMEMGIGLSGTCHGTSLGFPVKIDPVECSYKNLPL